MTHATASSISIDQQIFYLNYTDAANAEAFAFLYGNLVRHIYGVGWHIWNGSYWKPDEGTIYQLVKELSKQRQMLISKYETDPKASAIKYDLALKLEKTSGARDCLKFAESTPPIHCLPKDMDKDPWLLACPNVTIHLDYSYVRSPSPSDYITHCTGIEYHKDAKAPRWEQFLEEIFVYPDKSPNYDLIDYIKRAVGYSITGKTNERCFFVLTGGGHNGKSTFLSILDEVLGDYAAVIPFNSLIEKGSESTGNDLASLRGKRFVSASEAEEQKSLNEVKIKRLTGGEEPISCRFLYHEYFSYTPTFKIWLASNYRPKIKGTDEAIWGRVKLIPFNNSFPPGSSTRDINLREKLRAEAPGILAWAVEGAMEWTDKGLKDCQTVIDATRNYRTEQDIFGEFLSENILPDPSNFLTTTELVQRYNRWAPANGHPLTNSISLGLAMKDSNYIGTKNNNGARGYKGYKLR